MSVFFGYRSGCSDYRARSRKSVILGAAICALVNAAPAFATSFDWGINEDYKQLDARGASDFDILLSGDVGARITGGGRSSVTNPFASPTLTTSKDRNGNTIVHFSGSNTIARDPNANRHFGIFGTGPKPRVIQKAWSYAAPPNRIAVPFANFAFLYNAGAAALNFIVQNTSADTISLQDAGFLVTSSEFPIDSLNRGVLPPSAFLPLASLDHQYAPGSSDMVTLTGVSVAEFATTYGTLSFSGPSSGNPYDTTAGEWAEVAVVSAVPEPRSVMMLGIGFVLLAWRGKRRQCVTFTPS